MTRTNWLLAGAAALMLAGCDGAPTAAQAERPPAAASQAAGTGETDRTAETAATGMGERLRETVGGAVAATRQAAADAGAAIRDEIGSIDTRDIAKAIRAVGWGFEAAGRIVGEAAERAASNLEAAAPPEVRETARTAPETMPAQ